MKKSNTIPLLIFAIFLIVSNVLPLYSFEGYSILRNTTSHLGAQGSPNAWIMNTVFILLGMMATWITFRSNIRYHQIIGIGFGFSLLLTGFFQHAPLIDSIPVNEFHDSMHSIFAGTTGFCFSLLSAGHGFMSRGTQKIAGIIMAFVAVTISIAMITFPDIAGILQRIMFVSAFGWLFFYMKAPKNRQVK